MSFIRLAETPSDECARTHSIYIDENNNRFTFYDPFSDRPNTEKEQNKNLDDVIKAIATCGAGHLRNNKNDKTDI